MENKLERIANGIYRITFGTPEKETAVNQIYRMTPQEDALNKLDSNQTLPFAPDDIQFSVSARGCRLTLPLKSGEDLYGFGLQLKSLRQTGKKRVIRVNSDPVADTGDSHAPAPLYFSTDGYGIMLDTLRYAFFYTGANAKTDTIKRKTETGEIALTEDELYQGKATQHPVFAEIPGATGISCYIFCGPTMRNAIQRYNLFSGGGCMVPDWSLGVWYRACGKSDETEISALGTLLREHHIPCDVLGFEPGWQSAAYSCSLDWSPERFPQHEKTVEKLNKAGFKINLWEHVFIHPSSPIFENLKPHSGDFAVWNGLVPDLTVKEAQNIFADYHRKKFVAEGIISFKLDECDNSDYIASPWSFPECSEFPSGKDGEQMHSALGMAYQCAIHKAITDAGYDSCSSVRSAHLFASPYPFILYSDLYNHQDFIRGVTTAGFSGMLWCPELRHAASETDYLRRLQAMILSPQMLLNIWSMPHPPWEQLDRDLNVAGELYPEETRRKLEAATVRQLRQRMTFIPYLLAAFARYRLEGIPPFRALAMDYPEEIRLRDIDFAWIAGDSLLVLPLRADETQKTLPLPPGKWYDFYTGECYENEFTAAPPADQLPILVKENSMIPLWHNPPDFIPQGKQTQFELELRCFGPHSKPFRLHAADAKKQGAILTAEVAPDGTLTGSAAHLFTIHRSTRSG